MNTGDPLKTYSRMFRDPRYAVHPSDEYRYQLVVGWVRQNRPRSILDIGIGRGRLVNDLAAGFHGMRVAGCDLANFAGQLPMVEFFEADLCTTVGRNLVRKADCEVISATDVLEHLPEEAQSEVLRCIRESCKTAILTIANHPDPWHDMELHLTQRPEDWWREKIESAGFVVVSRPETEVEHLYPFILSSS